MARPPGAKATPLFVKQILFTLQNAGDIKIYKQLKNPFGNPNLFVTENLTGNKRKF
jgi:hypothetical protein